MQGRRGTSPPHLGPLSWTLPRWGGPGPWGFLIPTQLGGLYRTLTLALANLLVSTWGEPQWGTSAWLGAHWSPATNLSHLSAMGSGVGWGEKLILPRPGSAVGGLWHEGFPLARISTETHFLPIPPVRCWEWVGEYKQIAILDPLSPMEA